MMPPGFVLLRTAFAKVAQAEANAHGRGPHTARQAASRLLGVLANGMLGAYRFDPGQTKINVPRDYWITQAETFQKDVMLIEAFNEISVKETELQSLIGTLIERPPDAPTTEHAQAKRGRKPKVNPYDIAWIVGVLTYAGQGMRSQSDFFGEVATRYNAEFGDESAPSETSLKPMIRRLFAELERHDKKSGAV